VKRFLSTVLAAAVLATFVSGCDSDADEGPPSLDGLWSLFSSEGIETDDVLYFHIAGQSATIYDFMGDEYDGGPDCYLIAPLSIEHVGADVYDITSPENVGFPLQVMIKRNGDEITLSNAQVGTAIYRRSARDVSEFTPECEEGADEEEEDEVAGKQILRGL